MTEVESELESFVETSPLPVGINFHWSSLTYINKVWQDLMVFGMLKAILGSFLVVFLLMVIQFRSLTLGLLSMVPLSVSILLSYALIGWVGKDYDMPVAVCSSLSLGLGIDFAIHFIQRSRQAFLLCQRCEEMKHEIAESAFPPDSKIVVSTMLVGIDHLPVKHHSPSHTYELVVSAVSPRIYPAPPLAQATAS